MVAPLPERQADGGASVTDRARHTSVPHPGVGPTATPGQTAPYWPSDEQAQANLDETPPRRRRWILVPGTPGVNGGAAGAIAVDEPDRVA